MEILGPERCEVFEKQLGDDFFRRVDASCAIRGSDANQEQLVAWLVFGGHEIIESGLRVDYVVKS